MIMIRQMMETNACNTQSEMLVHCMQVILLISLCDSIQFMDEIVLSARVKICSFFGKFSIKNMQNLNCHFSIALFTT